MGAAAAIGVLGFYAQADHEGSVVVGLVKERPVVIEERTAAEQGLEAFGQGGFHP
jgi:PII-like signaling protein